MGKNKKSKGNKGKGKNSPAVKLHSIDKSKAAEELNSKLAKRPTSMEVEKKMNDKNVTGRRMSANLVGVAKTLEKNMRRNSLQKGLETRKEISEMVDAGIISKGEGTNVSGKLANAAKSLEFAMKSDALSHEIAARSTIEELEESGKIKSSNVAPAIQSGKDKLEKAMRRDSIAHELEHRPDISELEANNVVKNVEVAPAIAATAVKLDRAMKVDEVTQRLESRPDMEDLVESGILNSGNVAGRIQGAAKKLEKAMTTDALAHSLERRPSLDDLKIAGIYKGGRGALASKANALEHAMTKDTVGRLLESRPDIDDLIDSGLMVTEAVAPSIQNAQKSLAKNLTKASLNRELRHRPTPRELRMRHPSIFLPATNEYASYEPAAPVFDASRSALRTRYAIALKAVARLEATNQITSEVKGGLKELILSQDKRIMAAIEVYEKERDAEDMLDTLYRISRHL